jgi:PAS domain S-box-containing protein
VLSRAARTASNAHSSRSGVTYPSSNDIAPNEKLRDGIWIIDADAETVYASERMAEILGTCSAEMIGKPSFFYVFPEDVEAAQRLFNAKVRGDTNPFRFRLKRQDGSPVWVDVQGTPMHNAAGVFKGIVGTFSVSN